MRTIRNSTSERILAPGLWLEFTAGQWTLDAGQWTLNNANTSIPVGIDEDLDAIIARWEKAVSS